MNKPRADAGARPPGFPGEPHGIGDLRLQLFLFAAAFVLHCFILWDYGRSPFFAALGWDAKVYWDWGKTIAAGDWSGGKCFYQAPLYPYVLAGVMTLVGEHLPWVYLLQGLLHCGSGVLVFRIGRRRGGKTAGVASSLLFIFYASFSFYALKVLTETLAVFLHLLVAYWLLEKRRAVFSALSGTALGLLVLCKAYAVLYLPAIAAYVIFSEDGSRVEKIKRVSAFGLPVLALMSLAATHNAFRGGGFVPIASDGGINFYIGNHAKATGSFSPVEGISLDIKHQESDARAAAERALGKSLRDSEISAYWFAKGFAFIRDHPWDFVVLEFKKLGLIVSGRETSSMYSYDFEKTHLTASLRYAFVNLYVLLPLALLGMAVCARRWRECALLYVMPATNVLFMLMFFMDERFRLPMVAFFCVWGGLAIGYLKDRVSSGVRLFDGALLLSGLGFALAMHRYDLRNYSPRRLDPSAFYNLGAACYGAGDLEGALWAYSKAEDLTQGDWLPRIGISSVLFAQGRTQEAVRIYEEAFSRLDGEWRAEVLRDDDLKPLRAYARWKREGGR
ncbi:MAG: glycosyltransferase family 39 protein [Elusimicrobiota bacterium]